MTTASETAAYCIFKPEEELCDNEADQKYGKYYRQIYRKLIGGAYPEMAPEEAVYAIAYAEASKQACYGKMDKIYDEGGLSKPQDETAGKAAFYMSSKHKGHHCHAEGAEKSEGAEPVEYVVGLAYGAPVEFYGHPDIIEQKETEKGRKSCNGTEVPGQFLSVSVYDMSPEHLDGCRKEPVYRIMGAGQEPVIGDIIEHEQSKGYEHEGPCSFYVMIQIIRKGLKHRKYQYDQHIYIEIPEMVGAAYGVPPGKEGHEGKLIFLRRGVKAL